MPSARITLVLAGLFWLTGGPSSGEDREAGKGDTVTVSGKVAEVNADRQHGRRGAGPRGGLLEGAGRAGEVHEPRGA